MLKSLRLPPFSVPYHTLPLPRLQIRSAPMASRRLSKSALATIKAHNAFSRPSLLLRSRAISSSFAHFSSRSSPNSFIFRPNSFIGVAGNGFPSVTQAAAHGLSLQFPSLRRFSATAAQVRCRLHVDFQFILLLLGRFRSLEVFNFAVSLLINFGFWWQLVDFSGESWNLSSWLHHLLVNVYSICALAVKKSVDFSFSVD